MKHPGFNDNLDAKMATLFPVDEGLPCREGTDLLSSFAEARPANIAFLMAQHLVDLRDSAFSAISEW